MKKLTVSFARLFVVSLFTGATLTSSAASLTNPTNPDRTLPVSARFDLTETAHRLITQGNHHARRGETALALEYYSRSIRVGKLTNPDYADLATQNKIVALVKQLNQEQTHQTIADLIAQADRCAGDQPKHALELYSQSIRVGKQHHDEYTDAETQAKVVKLVKVLGKLWGK